MKTTYIGKVPIKLFWFKPEYWQGIVTPGETVDMPEQIWLEYANNPEFVSEQGTGASTAFTEYLQL